MAPREKTRKPARDAKTLTTTLADIVQEIFVEVVVAQLTPPMRWNRFYVKQTRDYSFDVAVLEVPKRHIEGKGLPGALDPPQTCKGEMVATPFTQDFEVSHKICVQLLRVQQRREVLGIAESRPISVRTHACTELFIGSPMRMCAFLGRYL